MTDVRCAAIAGLGRDATLVGGWRAPKLTADGKGLPSGDMEMFGLSLSGVHKLDALARVFQDFGFRLHENWECR